MINEASNSKLKEIVDALGKGQFGAVTAQPGVGKTAFLVQLAINVLLQGKKVLHVSIKDPVNKVHLWYREMFARRFPGEKRHEMGEDIINHRFIMAFKEQDFHQERLMDRLEELTVQGIFIPEILIIDGLNFAMIEREALLAIKGMAEKRELKTWFSVPLARGEAHFPHEDLFSLIFHLYPEGNRIPVTIAKGQHSFSPLYLDATTMVMEI